MDTGIITFIAVVLFRLSVPFLLFRNTLFGAILCIVADASDVMLFEKFGSGPLTDSLYHNFDKVFDIYYLSFELLIAFRWKDILAKNTTIGLFAWRMLGFLIFELSSFYGAPFRPVLFLFPNIFENFFIAVIVIKKFVPQFVMTKKSLLIILFVTSVPKLIQEYIMHYKYPDRTWYFLRDNFFFFLY